MSRTKNDEKIVFVQLINDSKDVLFGKYDDSKNITKETKKKHWFEISEELDSIGIQLIPKDKDFTYLRDVVWRNLLSTTKKKVDAKKKTGNGQIISLMLWMKWWSM